MGGAAPHEKKRGGLGGGAPPTGKKQSDFFKNKVMFQKWAISQKLATFRKKVAWSNRLVGSFYLLEAIKYAKKPKMKNLFFT